MYQQIKLFSMLAAIVTLSACTSIPTGPRMLALPGTGKSFDQFRLDENDCRQYASAQVGEGTANDAGANSGVKAGESDNLQQRYDFAYIQCMYAKGHRVPVSGNLEDSKQPVRKNTASQPAASTTPSLPSATSVVPPPPPAGSPPPPPPDVSSTP